MPQSTLIVPWGFLVMLLVGYRSDLVYLWRLKDNLGYLRMYQQAYHNGLSYDGTEGFHDRLGLQ